MSTSWPPHPTRIESGQADGEPLIDPDCRDGKHGSCVGCDCGCHSADAIGGACPVCGSPTAVIANPLAPFDGIPLLRHCTKESTGEFDACLWERREQLP